MEFIKPVYALENDVDYIDFLINHINLFCKEKYYDVIEWIYKYLSANSALYHYKEAIEKYSIYYGLWDMITKYDIPIPNIIDDLYSKIDLDFMEKIKSKTKLGSKLVKKFIRKKRTDILKIYLYGIVLNENDIDQICSTGNDILLQLLKDNQFISGLTNKQLYNCLKHGHIDIFQKWYTPGEHIIDDKIFKYIAYYNYSEFALHIVKEFPEISEPLILMIAACGHKDLLKNIFEIYPASHIKDTEKLIYYACASQNPDIVNICQEHLNKNDIELRGKIASVKYDCRNDSIKVYLSSKYGITSDDKLDYIKTQVNRTKTDIENIEGYEQLSPEWFNARKPIITSTGVAAIVGHNKYQDIDKFLKDKLWSLFKGNEATMYGNSVEIFGYDKTYLMLCEEYVGKKNAMFVSLRDPGLLLWDQHPWIGASSDGLVKVYYSNENIYDLTIELKSPFNKNEFYPEIPHYYYDQIMTAMQTTHTTECKFVVCLPDKLQYNTYEFKDVYWKTEIMPILYEKYFKNVITSMILKEKGRLYKGTIKPAIVFSKSEINLF